MTKANLSRRRTIQIIGATAGLPLLGSRALAKANNIPLTEWSGQALGAQSKILLAHSDESRLRKALGSVLNEIDRLENIFSLFISSSEVSMLNRDGRLKNPCLDLRLVLREALRFGDMTDGTFDVTVQPLWALLAEHFRSHSRPPDRAKIERVMGLVDYRQLRVEETEIAFAKPGMSLTLNGIAQGYITDRAAYILKNEGFDQTLIHLGETVALKPKQSGQPWRLALSGEGASNSDNTVNLVDHALATSAPGALQFDRDGTFTHILNPAGKTRTTLAKSVSVVADDAMPADALSTALTMIDRAEWPRLLNMSGADYARAQMSDGTWIHVEPAA